MTITVQQFTVNAQTVGTTEYSLTNASTTIATQTTAGYFSILVEIPSIAAGDEFEVAVREKTLTGGTQHRTVIANLVSGQVPFYGIPIVLGVGWDYTIKKLTGTDRAVTARVSGVT